MLRARIKAHRYLNWVYSFFENQEVLRMISTLGWDEKLKQQIYSRFKKLVFQTRLIKSL